MEIANIDDDGDPQVLTDSGTESFNESPLADVENIAPTTLLTPTDLSIDCGKRLKNVRNILDKSISIDEDILMKPLEPIICNTHSHPHIVSNNNHLTAMEIHQFVSILRRESCYENRDEFETIMASPRRVSFPKEMNVLASYKEPECKATYEITNLISAQDILAGYENSCKKHHTIELDTIKNQILDIKNNTNYTSILNMSTLNISMEVSETLEDLFKFVNFGTIIIRECKFSSESIREFMNILEFYNSSHEYIIRDPFKDYDYWKLFCCMASKSHKLRSITFEDFNLTDPYMRCIISMVRINPKINTLKFIRCNLSMVPSLVEVLMSNRSIEGLYLPQTGLYTKEADCLGRYLKKYHFLKVLDVSNNCIGDRGLEVLARGLCTQVIIGMGLSVLVVFNNQITEKSGTALNNIITECKNMHTLNIGFNNLTDNIINKIESGLEVTKSLEGLGLQSTLLTDIGISRLADAIQKNTSLMKINMKGNKGIQKDGLLCFSKAITNTKIANVELDFINRNCDDQRSYWELVKQICEICTVNKTKADQSDTEVGWSMSFTRKVSLNCEPIFQDPTILMEPLLNARIKKSASPCPSPIPSPGCSPTPMGRFSVSPVPDVKPPQQQQQKSRFRVHTVPDFTVSNESLANSPPLDEEDEVGRTQMKQIGRFFISS